MEALQTNKDTAAIDPAVLESVLLAGDLKRLTPVQKLSYYKSVCESLGLNPLTQPFAYIVLNGKEVLYAKREATEQLRNVHQISIDIKAREVIEGCYIVTATATMPTGRRDESTGSVAIENLKGEARANALMKAETKAKRRVTLSICGLGLLDESEIESIPSARLAPISSETVVIERPPVKAPEAVMVKAQVSASGVIFSPDETEATMKSQASEVFLGSAPIELPTALKQVVIEPDDPFIDDPYIDSVQAGKIAKRFRESLREELQPMAEELRHNALAYYKMIDRDGNPSSLVIKQRDYIEIGRKLVAYARNL